MDTRFIHRIDAAGTALSIPDGGIHVALRQGEALHRSFRPNIAGDYIAYLRQMSAEGAGIVQLVDENEVRAVAVWRTFLTTYCGVASRSMISLPPRVGGQRVMAQP